MQWRTCQEERIPPHIPTPPTQLLQIPHLSDSRAPMHKQPLMQTPAVSKLRRPCLQCHRITYNGGEVALVKPSDGLLAGLETDGDTVVSRA
jgi:hypothetical protein